jgi:hypothetical protein
MGDMRDAPSIVVASMAAKCYAHHVLNPDFRVLQFDSVCVRIGMQVMGRALDKSTRAEFNGRPYPRMEKSAPHS